MESTIEKIIEKKTVRRISDDITSNYSRNTKTIIHFTNGHAPLNFRNIPSVDINDIIYINRKTGSMKGIPLITQVIEIINNKKNERIGLQTKIIESVPETGDFNTIIINL